MKEDKKLKAKLIGIIVNSDMGLTEEDIADFDMKDLQDLADECTPEADDDEEEEEEVEVVKPTKKAAPKKEEKPAKKKAPEPEPEEEEEDDEDEEIDEEEEEDEEEIEVKELKTSKAVKAAKEKKEAKKKEFAPKIEHDSKSLKPLYKLMKENGAISKDLTRGVTFYINGKAVFSYDALKKVGEGYVGGLYFNSLKGIEACQKFLPKAFLKENELVKYSPNLLFVRNMSPADVIELLVEQEVLDTLLNATKKSVAKATVNKEKMAEDLKKGKAATSTKSKAQPAEEFEEEEEENDFIPVVSKGKAKTVVPAKKAAAAVVPAKKKK